MSLSSADAAFAHLQELLDELPGMQELGEKARLAHVADKAAALEASALADLDARIAAYQDDYQRTYELCQSFEDSEGSRG